MAVILGKMTGKSWKPYCGNFVQAPHGVIYRVSYVHGKQLTTALTGCLKKAYGSNFFDLRASIDEEWVFADGSYICCHQHSSGTRRGELRTTGKSRDGTTTKIHLAVDSHGNSIDFKITGGDIHDSQAVDDIIEMLTDAPYLIADKTYDSQTIRNKLKQDNIIPIISKRKNAKQPNVAFDHYLYKLRHLVENTFARLKHFRSIATRYEPLKRVSNLSDCIGTTNCAKSLVLHYGAGIPKNIIEKVSFTLVVNGKKEHIAYTIPLEYTYQYSYLTKLMSV